MAIWKRKKTDYYGCCCRFLVYAIRGLPI